MASTSAYAISNAGHTLGDEYVELTENQTSPQVKSAVISFECPQKFERLEYVGERDPTYFVPRTMEAHDGDGTITTFDLAADIQPVAGETDLDEQDYPAVVAAEAGGAQLEIESVDYAANSVTLAAAPAAGTENVKLYPIITEGSIQYKGVNSLDTEEGPAYEMPFPIYRFHDMKQNQKGRELRLKGRASWTHFERVELHVDSPRTVVWEDPDYPLGAYVSTLKQQVNISLD